MPAATPGGRGREASASSSSPRSVRARLPGPRSRDIWRKAGTAGAALLVALALGGAALADSPRAGASKRLPRAFQGMSPQIPHDVEARKGLCQECHTTGEDKALITPHPTRAYFCLNCHVGQTSNLPPFETTRPK